MGIDAFFRHTNSEMVIKTVMSIIEQEAQTWGRGGELGNKRCDRKPVSSVEGVTLLFRMRVGSGFRISRDVSYTGSRS